MADENVVMEIPLKYAISTKKVPGTDRSTGKATTKIGKEKTKIRNLVVTDFRMAFLDKDNEFTTDKSMKKKKMSERHFFFYDNNAFKMYLQDISKNNARLVDEYKKENPTFAKYCIKRESDIPGKFIKKFWEKGYVNSAYVLDTISAGSEKEFLHGTINAGIGKKVALGILQKGKFSDGFFDSFKKGFALQGRGLKLDYIIGYQTLVKMHPRLATVAKKYGIYWPTGMFVRPINDYNGNMQVFIEAVTDKVNEMQIYKNTDNIAELVKLLVN